MAGAKSRALVSAGSEPHQTAREITKSFLKYGSVVNVHPARLDEDERGTGWPETFPCAG